MTLLEECDSKYMAREKEEAWIKQLTPSLNWEHNRPERRNKGCVKGGVTVKGTWFPTKKAAWEALGTTPLNTFKTRFHRHQNLEYALFGTSELNLVKSI